MTPSLRLTSTTIDGLAFERKRRITGDDEQARNLGKIGNQVLETSGDIDADPEHYSANFGQGVIVPRHRYLNGEHVAHRTHGAPELDQNSVTARFDDASAVGGNPRVDNLGMQAPKACPRTFLVLLDKSRIADHICDKNCREPSLDAFFGHVMRYFQINRRMRL